MDIRFHCLKARQIRLDVEVKLPDGGLSLVETKINQSITKKAFQTAQHLVGELLKLKGMNEESVSDVLQVSYFERKEPPWLRFFSHELTFSRLYSKFVA